MRSERPGGRDLAGHREELRLYSKCDSGEREPAGLGVEKAYPGGLAQDPESSEPHLLWAPESRFSVKLTAFPWLGQSPGSSRHRGEGTGWM